MPRPGKLLIAMAMFAVFSIAAAIPALADPVNIEVEPNDTFLTAQTVFTATGPIRVDGAILGTTSTQPDFFRFFAEAGATLTLTVDVTSVLPGGIGDPVLILLTPAGNPKQLSTGIPLILVFIVSETGFFGAAVSGFGDFDIDGGGLNTDFEYRLTISGVPTQVPAVPEPATMILLGTGLAGIAAKVRRRRKS